MHRVTPSLCCIAPSHTPAAETEIETEADLGIAELMKEMS
jgi:hypothetical protein